MYLCFCDLCNNPIKNQENKCVLTVTNTPQDDEENNFYKDKTFADTVEYLQEFQKHYKTQSNKMKIYEICNSCKKLIDYMFSLRLDQIKSMQEEIKRLYNEKGDKRGI